VELSLLCVTQGAERALPFLKTFSELCERLGAEFVCAADGDVAFNRLREWWEAEGIVGALVKVQSQGFLESVLDDAIALTHGDYVLRLDDDESPSPAMERWLMEGRYRTFDIWSFARVHFWGDVNTVLMSRHYFPDVQTRLSVRRKAGGRNQLHEPSPFGAGCVAPVCMEHWNYIVKPDQEQRDDAARYESILKGGSQGKYRSASFKDQHAGKMFTVGDYDHEGRVPLNVRNLRKILI
jgi:hypothetical protein